MSESIYGWVSDEVIEAVEKEVAQREITQSEFVATAVREKLGLDEESDEKRHVDTDGSIEMKFTDFEARYLGNALWQVGESFGKQGEDHVESDYKWWARRFHAECKTREDNE
jgi:hypothetical protein